MIQYRILTYLYLEVVIRKQEDYVEIQPVTETVQKKIPRRTKTSTEDVRSI